MADEKNALLEAFKQEVRNRIGDDPHHGWGVEDSLAVIETVVNMDAEIEIPRLIAAGKKPEQYTLSDDALKLIKKPINPSQYRQDLEKAPRPTPIKGCKFMLAKSEKSRVEKEVFNYY